MDGGSSLRLPGRAGERRARPEPLPALAGWRGLEEGWRPGSPARGASSALTPCPAAVGWDSASLG